MMACGLVRSAAAMIGGGKNPVGLPAVGKLLDDLVGDLNGFLPLPRPPIHLCEHDLEIGSVRILLKRSPQLSDGLWVELAVSIHPGQGAPCQPHLVGFDAVSSSDQTTELLLDGRIGGGRLEGAVHVPDRGGGCGLSHRLILKGKYAPDDGFAQAGFQCPSCGAPRTPDWPLFEPQSGQAVGPPAIAIADHARRTGSSSRPPAPWRAGAGNGPHLALLRLTQLLCGAANSGAKTAVREMS